MLVDLNVFKNRLAEAVSEETVDTSELNPYLLNEVLQPLLAGKDLCYGDIDYSRFDADDLREIAYYCKMRNGAAYNLQGLTESIINAEPCPCKSRTFC